MEYFPARFDLADHQSTTSGVAFRSTRPQLVCERQQQRCKVVHGWPGLQDHKEGTGVMNWVERRERYTGNWKQDLQCGYGEHVWIEERCTAREDGHAVQPQQTSERSLLEICGGYSQHKDRDCLSICVSL